MALLPGAQQAEAAFETLDDAGEASEALPPGLRDIVPIEEVPLDQWREVFDTLGWPASLSRERFDYAALGNLLDEGQLPGGFVLLLQALHELGVDDGVDVLLEQAVDLGIDTAAWPTELGPRGFVVAVWLRGRGEPKVAQAIQLARLTLFERAAPLSPREFAARECRPWELAATTEGRLQRLLVPLFERLHYGVDLTVSARIDDDFVWFRIVRGGHIQTPRVWEKGRRRTLRYRPAQCDVVRYEPTTGRLLVPTRSSTLLTEYPRVFGEVMFEDAGFFSDHRVCTLKPVQDLLATAFVLEEYDGIVDRVDLVECLWHRPDGSRVRLSGRDCFGQIADLRLPITEGVLVEAKLHIHFTGRRDGRATVSVRVPGRIHCHQPEHRDWVNRYLERVGIRLRAAQPSTMQDVWGLVDFVYPAQTWRQAHPRHYEVFIQRRVLVPRALLGAPGEDGNVPAPLRRELIDGGEQVVAVGDDAGKPSRVVAATPGGLALERGALARMVAEELGFRGDREETLMRGCIDLGTTDLGAATVRGFVLLAGATFATAELDELIQQRCGEGERAVLLLPEGRDVDTSLPAVQGNLLDVQRCEWLPAIVDALRLGAAVPAIFRARREHVLVLDVGREKFWALGQPIELPEREWNFVLTVLRAKRDNVAVGTKALKERVSRRAKGPDDSNARKAKSAVRDRIQEALGERAAELPEDLFPLIQQGGGYDVAVCFLLQEPLTPGVRRP